MKYIKTYEDLNSEKNIIGKIIRKFNTPLEFAEVLLNGVVEELSFKDFSVSMSYLLIAEEDLAQNKESVTPNEPIDVVYNINTNDAFLLDGYHRYLKARGGTIQNALKDSRENKFGKILCKVKFEKNIIGGNGFTYTEPLDKNDLIKLYKNHI
jgi:hypothetical protein